MKHRGQYSPCRRTDTPDSISAVLKYMIQMKESDYTNVGTARENGKSLCRPLSRRIKYERDIRTPQTDKLYEPLYISTEDFGKMGKIFPNFLLQKRIISDMHKFAYSFSCMMI